MAAKVIPADHLATALQRMGARMVRRGSRGILYKTAAGAYILVSRSGNKVQLERVSSDCNCG